jgi:hypothetical protein
MAMISLVAFSSSSAHGNLKFHFQARLNEMLRSNILPASLNPNSNTSDTLAHNREFSIGNPAGAQSSLSMTEAFFQDLRPLAIEPDRQFGNSISYTESVFELTPSQYFGSDIFDDPLMFTAETQLLIVDPKVQGWEGLVESITANAPSERFHVFLLDSTRSGLEQITESILEFDDLSAVHLISHGESGELFVGNNRFGGDLSAKEIQEISSWRNHLTDKADILIYGCDLASNAAGQDFIDSLARLSGADIAASNDLTGSHLLNGDWDLEFTTGKIEHLADVKKLAQSNWFGVLGTVNIDQAWLTARGSGPYYLDEADTTYVLQTDVTTTGTAFAIIAHDVDFDLNGYTITYNDSNAISVANHSFETGSGNVANQWDFANSGTGQRYQGEFLENEVYDGNYSLRFGVTNGDQYVTSTSTVTLEANTTYSLTSMMYFDGPGSIHRKNPGVETYVRLENATSGETVETVARNTNWRGIQLTEKTFTTGATSESFKIVAGVRHDEALADHYGIIDNIKIQKYRAYGVAISAHSWAPEYFPGFNDFGWGHRSTVRNGTITQGRDQATSSHGILLYGSTDATIDNVEVTVAGANSSAVFARDNAINMTIKNSDFTSDVKTLTSRDNFDGAVLKGVSGEVFGNTIHNGVHAGIVVAKAGTIVHNNVIRLKAKYTNAFAIFGGQEVYNNVIDNGTGDYSSRGIMSGGGSSIDPRKIHNNKIRVQGFDDNQEYFGGAPGGAYGIQIEGAAQAEVYENDVTATGGATEAYAFRMNESTDTSNVHVHNNIFRGIRIGAGPDAASIHLTKVPYQSVLFENNLLESNDQWLGQSSNVDRIVFRGNTLKAVGDTTGFKALESFNWQQNDVLSVRDLEFIDTQFADTASRNLFVDSPFHAPVVGADDHSSFSQRFNTTFRIIAADGSPLDNANVKVFNKDGMEVFNGTSNVAGNVTALLKEFRTQGSTKTSYGPFTVRATSGSQVHEIEFDADKKQTIDVHIDGTTPEVSFSYDGQNLTVVGTNADNHFEWNASRPLELIVDEQRYDIQIGTTHIGLFGRDGDDQVTIVGTTNDDTLIAGPNGSRFRNNSMEVAFSQTELHHIDGGGGQDETYLTDSNGNDSFVLQDNFASIAASGWNLEATGFQRQSVRAIHGGNDSIEVSTSRSGSTLNGRNAWISLSSGATYKSLTGFDSIELNALGTRNSLFYEDSAGDDQVAFATASLNYSNSNFSMLAKGFDTQVFTSILGGNDSVDFGNTGFTDTVVSRSDSISLTGGEHFWRAVGFDSATATGSYSEKDEVFAQDSLGNDSFSATPTAAVLSSEESTVTLSGFFRARVDFRNGGYDDVSMLGSGRADLLVGSPEQLRFSGDGYDNFVKGFDEAFVDAKLGVDAAYLLDTAGDDALTLREVGFFLTSPGKSVNGTGFETKNVNATQGGNDSVNLYDTVHDDDVVSRAGFTVVRNSFNVYNRVSGFDSVELFQSTFTDADHLTLYGSNGSDQYSFDGAKASVIRGVSSRTFNGMDNVVAYWNSGIDHINENDPNYDLTLNDQAS